MLKNNTVHTHITRTHHIERINNILSIRYFYKLSNFLLNSLNIKAFIKYNVTYIIKTL